MSPRRSYWVQCLTLLSLLGALSVCVRAQTGTAVVVGTVTDKNGAPLPGVKVTATNVDTGLSISVNTDPSGAYRLPGLAAGPYEIRLEKEQFSTEVRRGVTLTVAQQVAINLSMQLSAIKQEVIVSGDAPLVENVTSALSGLVNDTQMRELPLNGRDVFQLVLLQVGVSPNPSAGPSPWQKGGVGKAAVNGQRPTNNNLTIDGMDANDPNFNVTPGGASGVFLGIEAIREFRIFTDTYNAEYGRNSGSIIQAVTKSGTNALHGSLFEFHRNAALDAKNFFDLAQEPIPPFIRNQFGGTFGGALRKDRAFFFVGYEGFREGQGITAVTTVPNDLAHRGFLPSRTNPAACTEANPSGCVNVGVNAQIAPYLDIVTLPNGPDFGNGTGQITSTQRRITNEHNVTGRFDFAFANDHTLFARYIFDTSESLHPYLSTLVPGFPGINDVGYHFFTVQDQKFLRSNLLNVLAFGFNRFSLLAEPQDLHPGLSISLLANRPLGALTVAGSGIGVIGNNLIYPLASYSNTFQVQDNVSWTKGRHAVKFGGEYRRLQVNGPFDLLVNGGYTFQDLSIFGIPAASNNPALEFFLKGVPLVYVGTEPALSNSDRGFRQHWFAGYLQDDWRVNNRLTLNAGVRYEVYSNPTEAGGREVNIRNLATDAAPTVGKFMESTPKNLFQPRLGFAWDMQANGRTLLRGGVGLFNDQIWANIYGNARSLPPFYGAFFSIFPEFLNPTNAFIVAPTANATLDFHPKWPSVLQYNLNLQRELTSQSVLKLAYVGSRGNHLGRLVEGNPFVLSMGQRINPNFGSIVRYLTDAQSFYNALQISWEQRPMKGLSFQVNYNYASSIDDSSGYNPSDAVNDSGKTQDHNNRKGSRGRSGFDVRHNFVFNFLYELPFGPGKTLGQGTTGVAAKIIGGWQLTGIGTFHSNVPFTPVLGFDNAGTQSIVNADRPNLVGNSFSGSCPNGAPVHTVTCWFNPAAYQLPAAGTFGNAGRNSLAGPTFSNFDLGLLKQTTVAEGKTLELRAEFFNLANHPNFAVPTNTTGPNGSGGNGDAVFQANAGRIFSTVGTSRQIQFGLKFLF